MPGIYKQDEYDVAGFAVGVVDKKDIIDGSKIKAGDVIIGLASNGIHSNGYSLVRSVFSKDYLIKNSNLFYRPTKIYVRAILALKEKVKIKGIAHITGGGFYDNIERILPKKICAEIDVNSWQIPKVFNLIQNKAKLSKKEMFGTFNMGIGMVVIISRKDTKKALNILDKNNVTSSVIGNCQPGKKSKVIII
jgi:phosphoribosylformylglycinamidine cyclo-ligase